MMRRRQRMTEQLQSKLLSTSVSTNTEMLCVSV
ncbi:hypothetical protein OYC64_014266 [Pagothenia borchgrevinki]|uniref:Uncharacterized protein n=1 Tax=Pagothenia borchgrevinki TaxID=8213 RepID=A0ABD2H0J5_PAGBO